ncbi:MAG: SOS response-associated peptidase [Thermoflexales bacterium]|nr:SOS response-associated peptidase [Thermoflexales bacterium]
MCGRYVISILPDALIEAFELGRYETPETAESLRLPRYNIAPTQRVAVTLNESPDALSTARWGLIPSWAKDESIASNLINARSETLPEKPAFRAAFKRRRCLIYASGFYEWRKEDPAGKVKTPLFIHLKDQRPFAMAGLWEMWTPPDGEPRRTCTIITTEPNPLLASVHNRMPVILPPAARAIWLDGDAPADALMSLLTPYPAEAMTFHAVSKRVNTPRNDDAALIAPEGGQAGLL